MSISNFTPPAGAPATNPYAGDLLRLSGGENVVSSLQRSGTVSAEAIIHGDPEVIFVVDGFTSPMNSPDAAAGAKSPPSATGGSSRSIANTSFPVTIRLAPSGRCRCISTPRKQ
ncbi:MAG: hypothetical protein L6W00_25965 [Lentisphaeria bacterium]|nr:MAG: hypothetical protein L6W00_25965 [Lentisphaeria bacterium]